MSEDAEAPAAVTSIELPAEFRAALSLIETYLAGSAGYTADIAELETELLEETGLRQLLESQDAAAFEAIRQTFRTFATGAQDRRAKTARLEALHRELRVVITLNDQLLRENAAIPDILRPVEAADLSAAASIPTKIEAIKEFLRQKGRRGTNPIFSLYVPPTTGTTRSEFHLPDDALHVRAIVSTHGAGYDQLVVNRDCVGLVRVGGLPPRGTTFVEGSDATLDIFVRSKSGLADGPGAGRRERGRAVGSRGARHKGERARLRRLGLFRRVHRAPYRR